MQIAQTDFSFDCMKTTQEYLMYFKEFSCNQAENMQAKCVLRFIQRFLSIASILETALMTSKSKIEVNSKKAPNHTSQIL